jgi:hypothetical protein
MVVDSIEQQAERIANQVWLPKVSSPNLFNGEPADSLTWSSWCDYYESQWHEYVSNDDGAHVAISSCDELRLLIDDILASKPRAEVLTSLKVRVGMLFDDECYKSSIDHAARLAVMMKFGTVPHQVVRRCALNWENGGLREHLADYFSKQIPVLSTSQVRLPRTFDAWSIQKVSGIRICFTSNLADHLRLEEDDTTVLVFHHVSWLECQRSRYLAQSPPQ